MAALAAGATAGSSDMGPLFTAAAAAIGTDRRPTATSRRVTGAECPGSLPQDHEIEGAARSGEPLRTFGVDMAVLLRHDLALRDAAPLPTPLGWTGGIR